MAAAPPGRLLLQQLFAAARLIVACRPGGWLCKFTRLSFCLALATVAVSAQEADGDSESEPPGLIAFFSTRDGDYEIYLMNPDGSQIAFTFDRGGSADIYLTNVDGSDDTQLTDSPGVSSHPSWSPDSQRIAFESDRDGNFEICVMNADGTGIIPLTVDSGGKLSPK